MRSSSCPSQAFPSVRFHGRVVDQVELSNGKVFRTSEGWHLELHLLAGSNEGHHVHITNGRSTNLIVPAGSGPARGAYGPVTVIYAGDEHPTECEISGVHKIEHVRESMREERRALQRQVAS